MGYVLCSLVSGGVSLLLSAALLRRYEQHMQRRFLRVYRLLDLLCDRHGHTDDRAAEGTAREKAPPGKAGRKGGAHAREPESRPQGGGADPAADGGQAGADAQSLSED